MKFHHLRHPLEMGKAEVEAFLTHLAVKRRVAAPTQNQALNALVFLYREVLKTPFEGVDVKTTEIYAHAAKIGNGKGVRSPLNAMGVAV